MLARSLRQTEHVVLEALEAAARDYRQDRGRFLPFAENRIHDALEDYQRSLRYIPKISHRSGWRRRRNESKIDAAAFRRAFLARGVVL